MPRAFIARTKGLNPLVDRKQTNEPFVVSGKNFLVDAEGPVSGFGRDLISYKAIDDPTNVQVFEISETLESFICTNVGIFRLDTYSRKLIPLYIFTTVVTSQFPWSFAAVGNRYYFARKDFGLLEYDISLDTWQELTGGSIPINIYACEESEGRLILLTDLWIAWSAIGDGQDFVASASTGAGAQALTKMGLSNPVPLGMKSVPDGFLTFVSSGIIKSQAINAVSPFRHTTLSRHHTPVNPYCLSKTVVQSVIILTKAGLFETDGRSLPVPWQPLMSEYLHTKVLPTLDLVNNQNNPKLGFDFDNEWFAIQISEQQVDYSYNKAYILNIPLGEWGSLDTSFVGLQKFKLVLTTKVGYEYGMIDNEGSIYEFNNAAGIEYVPSLVNGLFYYKPWTEYETVDADGILRLRTNANFNTIATLNLTQPGVFNLYAQKGEYLNPANVVAVDKASVVTEYVTPSAIADIAIADFAVADIASNAIYSITNFRTNTVFASGVIEVTVNKKSKSYNHLNSAITIGPFRISDTEINTRYMNITGLILGMDNAAVGDTEDDWASTLLYPNDVIADWNLISGEEDWGDGASSGIDYDLTIIPTKEGYTEIVDNGASLELLNSEGVSRFYSVDANAIYHLLQISAESLNKNYHLKTLDIDYIPGGLI